MRKVIYSVGTIALVAAAAFVWSRTALQTPQASTVGLAQRASAPLISPSDMMSNVAHMLPVERWDAH